MAAFFPRNLYNNADSSFTPLFRLLDDFDNYSRHQGGQGRRAGGLPSWQPKFDIRETGDAYELHGELPGMVKENVNIEFTDPQTMLVRGRVESSYTAGTPPAGHIEGGATVAGAITEGGEERRNSHHATVEDETDAQAAGSEGQQVSTTTNTNTSEKKQPADKAKYWLTERSIGEFSRSFSFPTRVEQEGVTAGLKDGILTVTVPKAKKHETRRIAIN